MRIPKTKVVGTLQVKLFGNGQYMNLHQILEKLTFEMIPVIGKDPVSHSCADARAFSLTAIIIVGR